MVQNSTRICLTFPPKIQSPGVGRLMYNGHNNQFNVTGSYDWYQKFSLPRLEMQIALIFVVTQIVHSILKRFGLPIFTSQLIAGLLLSQAISWTDEGIQVLGTIGIFGYAFFLFLTGVKMDPSMITRVNKRSFYIGALSVIAPLLSILPLILHNFNEDDKKNQDVDHKLLSN